jgi:hypothetical protein
MMENPLTVKALRMGSSVLKVTRSGNMEQYKKIFD